MSETKKTKKAAPKKKEATALVCFWRCPIKAADGSMLVCGEPTEVNETTLSEYTEGRDYVRV